jgi:hypothetical protein
MEPALKADVISQNLFLRDLQPNLIAFGAVGNKIRRSAQSI